MYKRRAVLLTHDRVVERLKEMEETKIMIKYDNEFRAQEKIYRKQLHDDEKKSIAERKQMLRDQKSKQKADEKAFKEAEKARKRDYNEEAKAAKAAHKALKA